MKKDEKFDWFKKLDSIVWHYNNIVGKDVSLESINANGNLNDVINLVLYYINRHSGLL